MKPRDTEIVKTAIQLLQKKLGTERFELWFGERIQVSYTEANLEFSAANSFSLDLVKKNFRDEITAVLREIDTDLQAVFTVRAREPSAAPAEQAQTLAPPKTARVSRRPSAPRPPKLSVVGDRSAPATGRRFASLDTLVTGDCNSVAVTAAQMALREPGQISPILFHGPVGCGKTHLLEGIWSKFRQQYRQRRVVYLAAEQFTTYFLEALRGKGLPSFRRKYRDVDLLILDDMQFFHGKKATLVEVLNTLDAVLRDKRQIVLASDRPPGQLQGLGQEFITRISGGLICGLEPLDHNVRMELARRGDAQRGLNLSEEVLDFLAENIDGDGRQIAGVLNHLSARRQATQNDANIEDLQRILDDLYGCRDQPVHLADIDRLICDAFGIESQTLQSTTRVQHYVQPRMIAMWLARRHTRAGLNEISHHFGRRSHTTVLSADKRVTRWIDEQQEIVLDGVRTRVGDVIRKLERRLRAS